MEEKFAIVKQMIDLTHGMYGFDQSDYGRGVMQGIICTLRALGLLEGFRRFVQPKKEAADGETVLSDRVE